jgi:hypothetical protein
MQVSIEKDHQNWLIWHAEEMRVIPRVRRVDSETSCYSVLTYPLVIIGGKAQERLVRAREILVLPNRRLIIVNPVDDDVTAELDAIDEPTDIGRATR